ncbi:hypothetical protein EDD86DRAFT_218529 [Gorgonomyces haynaldii]|nr:hypothetical protein EDD86DRAFT_218529 [Gorgonomyces haynaldii]
MVKDEELPLGLLLPPPKQIQLKEFNADFCKEFIKLDELERFLENADTQLKETTKKLDHLKSEQRGLENQAIYLRESLRRSSLLLRAAKRLSGTKKQETVSHMALAHQQQAELEDRIVAIRELQRESAEKDVLRLEYVRQRIGSLFDRIFSKGDYPTERELERHWKQAEHNLKETLLRIEALESSQSSLWDVDAAIETLIEKTKPNDLRNLNTEHHYSLVEHQKTCKNALLVYPTPKDTHFYYFVFESTIINIYDLQQVRVSLRDHLQSLGDEIRVKKRSIRRLRQELQSAFRRLDGERRLVLQAMCLKYDGLVAATGESTDLPPPYTSPASPLAKNTPESLSRRPSQLFALDIVQSRSQELTFHQPHAQEGPASCPIFNHPLLDRPVTPSIRPVYTPRQSSLHQSAMIPSVTGVSMIRQSIVEEVPAQTAMDVELETPQPSQEFVDAVLQDQQMITETAIHQHMESEALKDQHMDSEAPKDQQMTETPTDQSMTDDTQEQQTPESKKDNLKEEREDHPELLDSDEDEEPIAILINRIHSMSPRKRRPLVELTESEKRILRNR